MATAPALTDSAEHADDFGERWLEALLALRPTRDGRDLLQWHITTYEWFGRLCDAAAAYDAAHPDTGACSEELQRVRRRLQDAHMEASETMDDARDRWRISTGDAARVNRERRRRAKILRRSFSTRGSLSQHHLGRARARGAGRPRGRRSPTRSCASGSSDDPGPPGHLGPAGGRSRHSIYSGSAVVS